MEKTKNYDFNNINTIINSLDIKLNIKLPVDNINNIKIYLRNILSIAKNPRVIPQSWLLEREELIKRLARYKIELENNYNDYAASDHFGDGLSKNGTSTSTEVDKHVRRKLLESKIIPQLDDQLKILDSKIETIKLDFDESIKDYIKELIKTVPNERHKDVMLQFYIYRQKMNDIAEATMLSIETVRDYNKRGFKSLCDILFDFSKKRHFEWFTPFYTNLFSGIIKNVRGQPLASSPLQHDEFQR